MFYSISFCTVCMNRLHHLKQTLPQNIVDNSDYPDVEFVVIDYNSQDGLEDWIHEEMSEYMALGILTYIKVEGPKYFHRSHSRNVAFLAARGEIVVNIDADNFAGKGFAHFINKQFQSQENIFLIPDKEQVDSTETFGKVSVRKEDFLALKGYDEQLVGWGFEDLDLYTRLQRFGLVEKRFTVPEFARCIVHDINERVSNQENTQHLKMLFARGAPRQDEFIFMYKDGTFERGEFIYDTSELQHFSANIRCVLKNDQMITGTWTLLGQAFILKHSHADFGDERIEFDVSIWPQYHSSNPRKRVYEKITLPENTHYALMVHQAAQNYSRFCKNYRAGRVVINEEFGVLRTPGISPLPIGNTHLS